MPLSWLLVLSAALFSIGLFGVLSRKNAVAILLGVELMLNAVNINLVSFWRYGDVNQFAGQVFAIIVFAVAAERFAFVTRMFLGGAAYGITGVGGTVNGGIVCVRAGGSYDGIGRRTSEGV